MKPLVECQNAVAIKAGDLMFDVALAVSHTLATPVRATSNPASASQKRSGKIYCDVSDIPPPPPPEDVGVSSSRFSFASFALSCPFQHVSPVDLIFHKDAHPSERKLLCSSASWPSFHTLYQSVVHRFKKSKAYFGLDIANLSVEYG